MTTYKINLQSYTKLLMHSLKYPYAKVNGLLLAPKSSDASEKAAVRFVDYIPLFHFNQGLTAMLEIALIQVQTYCAKHSLQIAGYFQVNKSFHDASIDVFAQRIVDKLVEQNPSAAIVMVSFFTCLGCYASNLELNLATILIDSLSFSSLSPITT